MGSDTQVTPKHDSTLGLIFRLNALWAEVSTPAKNGDYDGWNNVLDRIYCDLSYRGDMKIEKDDEGNIKSVEIDDDYEKVYRFLNSEIAKYRKLALTSKGEINGVPKKRIYRGLWFKAVRKKDIWLRKHMNFLQLYIKETKSSPGSSMFGGG